jgi:hypothetical protein
MTSRRSTKQAAEHTPWIGPVTLLLKLLIEIFKNK